MKCRIEPEGVHLYDRKTGLHILIDEVETSSSHYSIAPRTVSIAITDKCDFSCPYCYVNLKTNFLDTESIISFCNELDKLGTFDIAFGGGEPTLHPELSRICNAIWSKTDLGISITTHGHHLTPKVINELKGALSFIRISIDGTEPVYSKLRNEALKPLLKNLEYLKGKIPFGFNTVINSLTLKNLDSLLELAIQYEVKELLLLPMIVKGKTVLSDEEWKVFDKWISDNYQKIPMRISSISKTKISAPILFNSSEWDKDYAFIGVDKKFRENSFTKDGILIENNLNEIIQNWKNKITTANNGYK